jgi:hypothetical protein
MGKFIKWFVVVIVVLLAVDVFLIISYEKVEWWHAVEWRHINDSLKIYML